jgi:hypothetical protein
MRGVCYSWLAVPRVRTSGAGAYGETSPMALTLVMPAFQIIS